MPESSLIPVLTSHALEVSCLDDGTQSVPYVGVESSNCTTTCATNDGKDQLSSVLGKGGRDVRTCLETFQRKPCGWKARPEVFGQQLEASLASGEVTISAKRRQPVSKPGYTAPKSQSVVGSLRRVVIGGRVGVSFWLGASVPPGSENLCKETFEASPGTWEIPSSPRARIGGYRVTQSLVNKWTWYRQAKETKCGEMGVGKS